MIIFHAPDGDFAINGRHVVLLMPVTVPGKPELKTKIVLNAMGDDGKSISMTVNQSTADLVDAINTDRGQA